jgi:hypothetical protein
MKNEDEINYESSLAKVLFAFACGVAYFFSFKLNTMLFESLKFSHGVCWVFLPSGLRMLFVLVLLNSGSIGIALASLLLSYIDGSGEHHVFNIVTAFISGFAPLVARQICVDYLNVGNSLQNLNSKSLFQISFIFALISSLLHQVWFFWNEVTEDFIASSFVMVVGDWLGTVLILAAASLVVKIYSALTSAR